MFDRRSLAFAFAGLAVAATGATAQTAAAPGPMGDAEKKHVLDTLMAGTTSLEESKVALSKADNAMVKQFATFEVAEQTTIGEILKPLAGSPPPADPAAAEAMKMLEAAKGAAFDKDYITAQMKGHQKLLDIQETYLKTGANPMNVAVAKLARGMIKEHLTLLGDLEKRRA